MDPCAFISSILGSVSDRFDAEKTPYERNQYQRGFIIETLTPLAHFRENFSAIFVLTVPLSGFIRATTVIDMDMDTTGKLTLWEAEFAYHARIF